MQVGIRWAEVETNTNIVYPGTYNKECEYTKVTVNGEYSYNCWYFGEE